MAQRWSLAASAVAAACGLVASCSLSPGPGAHAVTAVPALSPRAVPTVVARPAATVVAGRVMARALAGFVPLAGARVTVAGGQVAETDGEGRYALVGTPAGPATLAVTHPDFRPGAHPIVVIPGLGTPRANVLLAPRAYGLRQVAGFDAGVSGVVTDPRGAALGGATVTLGCAQAHGGAGASLTTTTDPDGFFAASLRNVVPTGEAPRVTYEAAGTTPGGILVQTEAAAAVPLEGPQLSLNVQTTRFPEVSAPTVVGSAFVPPGATGEVEATNLSARADEYYLEIVSGAEAYDALPLRTFPGQATFRTPQTLADDVYTLTVVPFGLRARRSPVSASFVAVYSQAELERDITYAPGGGLADLTEAIGTINATRFMAGDVQRYALTLVNANERVAPVLDLVGRVSAGMAGVAAYANGVEAELEGPDAEGRFRVRGLAVPRAGRLPVTVEFRAPVTAASGQAFGPTALALEMPVPGLAKPTAPGLPTPLVVAGVDTSAFSFTKVLEDDGAPGNGVARVLLTLQPTHSLAGAAFKIADATKTEVASPATTAVFTGTVALPPAGVPLGLDISDLLNLKIDGKGAPVKVFGANYDAETLIGQINSAQGLAGLVKASRSGGKLVLERTEQGAGKTLEILPTPASAHMREVLGLPTGLLMSGFEADFKDVTATQPNGTAWTVVPAGVSWNGATGQTAATITLRPPASYAPGDGPASPLTLRYLVRKLNGTPAAFGGGTGTSLGPRTISYNLVAPFTRTADDRSFVRTGADAPAGSGF